MSKLKRCSHKDCMEMATKDSRSWSGRLLCDKHLDAYLEDRDAEHHCSRQDKISLADAIVGWAPCCSCGEPVELDDDDRREAADRIESALETLNGEEL